MTGFSLCWDNLGNVELPPAAADGSGAPPSANQATLKLDDVRLHRAAELARDVRQLVWDQLGYTCTAGVAHNKTLAKLASSRHKPNQQTVVLAGAVLRFMERLEIGKIRFLGGKLGANVEAMLDVKTVRCLFGCTRRVHRPGTMRYANLGLAMPRGTVPAWLPQAGELWHYDEAELRRRCGDAYGAWLYNVSRGIDNDPGTTRGIASRRLLTFRSAKSGSGKKVDGAARVCACVRACDDQWSRGARPSP